MSDVPIIDGLNTTAALPRVNNNAALYKKILLIFLSKNIDSYQNLLDAIHTGKIQDAILISHTLKGSAATIGADSLSTNVAIIEQHLRDQEIDQAVTLMESLRIEHEKVINSLQSVAEKIASVNTPKTTFDRDVVLELIEAVKTHLFEDLSKTEGSINSMLAIDFPDMFQPTLARIKLEYEHFNLIEVENLLDQLNQMLTSLSEQSL